MTPLRQRMLEDMQVRHLSPRTQRSYVEQVSRFARHFGRSPALLGLEEIRAYQVYLANEKQLAPASLTVAVAALRFLYTVTLRRGWAVEAAIPAPKVPDRLPVVLSATEVVQFLASVHAPKHRTILTACYAAGLRISEAVRLTPPAIDSQRMVLRIEQGKGQKDRYVMLSPTLLDILRDWWRVSRSRPWLFPGDHPGEPITTRAVNRACRTAQRRCGIPTPITPHSLPCVRRTPARSRHERPHHSVTAGPSQSRHHGPLSGDGHDHGVRDRQSAGLTPASGACGRRAVGPGLRLSPGPWIARRSRWETSSAATARPIGTPRIACCPRPSGAS